jgi:ABC-2 type transport system permease protein
MSTALNAIRRTLRLTGVVFSTAPKVFMAYSIWFWMEIIVTVFSMVIFLYFWRAIYASSGQATLSGLTLSQTLNYIILARVIGPALENRLIFSFGYYIREGLIAIEMLRPVDFQFRNYLEALGITFMSLLTKAPLLVIAVLFFGLRLPTTAAAWAAFVVAMLLGHAVLFLFDWLYACLAFYSTETWGLGVVREAVALLFSGGLLPLVMLPGWLQAIASGLPFAQGLYVPIALLSGILPPEAAPRLWLVQLAWIAGLLLVSRLVFDLSVRKVTVQGG